MPKLTKNLTNDLKIIKTPLFPKNYKNSLKGHFALLGVGGNIGDVLRRFEKLSFKLNSYKDIKVLASSFILQNPPFGYEAQPDFFNTLFLISTSLTPKELLKRVLIIEKRFKRKRSFKNAPRTLDIDIIFFDKMNFDSKKLWLPHPHWKERESITLPLVELLNRKKSKKISKILQKLLTNKKNQDIIPPQIKR